MNQPLNNRSIELTILMPCLNEEETVGLCVGIAKDFLERNQVAGEIVVVDNMSEDDSGSIAREAGARVIPCAQRGYGAALRTGIANARGTYIIMGDADCSYDFSNLMPMVRALRDGADLVMGDRFAGGIQEGAMPALHKYLGNPVLSGISRLVFGSKVRDFHCGLRGFNRERIQALPLTTTGMEFATELVAEAELAGYTVVQVPTTLAPDGRSGSPHLRSFRDGWRHLKFIMGHPGGKGRELIMVPILILWILLICHIIANQEIPEGIYACMGAGVEHMTPYVLVALAAWAAIRISSKARRPALSRRGRWICKGTGILFALAVVGAHEGLFLELIPWRPASILWGLEILFLAGTAFVIGEEILRGGHVLLAKKGNSPRKKGKPVAHPALIPFLLILIIDFIVLIFSMAPGVCSTDSIDQIRQILDGSYMNHHPIWHTWLIRLVLVPGMAVFHDIGKAVFLFSSIQILVMAGGFAYVCETVWRLTGSRKLWIFTVAWFAVLPYHAVFASTMWKDIPYALSVVLFICALYRVLHQKGRHLPIHWTLMIVCGLGVCVLRSNGWIAFAMTLAAFLVIYIIPRREKKSSRRVRAVAGILILILLAGHMMNGPIPDALDVERGEADEAFSIPMQQIARVVAEGEELTPEQRQELEGFMEVDRLPEVYKESWYDPVKFLARERGTDELLARDKGPFLRLWADIGKDHPGTYLRAWIHQTRGYWNGGYDDWVWLNYVADNDFGLEKTGGGNKAATALFRYGTLFSLPGLDALLAIGLHSWFLWILMMLCLWNRRNVIYFIPAMANLLTLLLATPVAGEFRYIYCMFTCLPMLVAVTVLSAKAGEAKAEDAPAGPAVDDEDRV